MFCTTHLKNGSNAKTIDWEAIEFGVPVTFGVLIYA